MVGIGGSNKGGFGKNGSRSKPALIRLWTIFRPVNSRKGMEASWNLHTIFAKKMADAQTLFQCGFAPDFVVFSKETVSMIIGYFEFSFDNSNTVVLYFLFWYITLIQPMLVRVVGVAYVRRQKGEKCRHRTIRDWVFTLDIFNTCIFNNWHTFVFIILFYIQY